MVLEAVGLAKRYPGSARDTVSQISFSIGSGETLGLLGESGSGKSTVGQMVAGILRPTAGRLFFQGEELSFPFRGEARRGIQILFQHPEVSFNPRLRLWDSIKEPYRFRRIPCQEDALVEFLAQFGIYREHLGRYPRELSGGELQRLALARVMLMQPKLVVLDEPTSMLDVISQAQVVHLLEEIQKQEGVSYLFISHDPILCRRFCSRILELCGE
ncbi:dipeptide/oligopeptide/nickel ABC transporter ATP-binding protein [Phocea massiliensis]|uniref:Oligopeptide transport ATP-binding protein OppF n=1 Tax=uncultured Anaerotruncus sp. TaxID=905011 RepID=A0A6N2TR89_9FIRM|nr:dipeptide/oligopeptide/nickel ABC transporter ATP-binding protein [Merdimmobilis hominis]MCD4835613.1 dipeptide/oligopeptide/nickel ABC transporter ATP-binding protein [Merdimmobilis hominis]